MAPLWTVKPSPGKGTGVFATEALPSGTLIMQDKAAVYVKGASRMAYKAEERNLLRTVNKLNPSDKAKFYALHEGTRKHATREMRIFKANAFGDEHGNGWLNFDVSRFNHSCVPNAETESDRDGPNTTTDVYAIHDIAAGEEIFINYKPDFDFAVCRQRQNALRVQYGFDCQCACCVGTPEEVWISDARRQVSKVLYFKLDDKEPPEFRIFDDVSEDIGSRPLVGDRIVPLSTPLTDQQQIAYRVLYPAVRVAEGLGGKGMVVKYQHAAYLLWKQMEVEAPIMVIESAKQIKLWVFKALQTWKQARGASPGATLMDAPKWKVAFEQNMLGPHVDLLLHDLVTNKKKADGTPRRSLAVKMGAELGSAIRTARWLDREETVAELRKQRKKAT